MNGDMVTGANILDGGDYDLQMDENGGVSSKHMKSLGNLYCNKLAVFAFNSTGCDVKLIETFLLKELCEHGQHFTSLSKILKVPMR